MSYGAMVDGSNVVTCLLPWDIAQVAETQVGGTWHEVDDPSTEILEALPVLLAKGRLSYSAGPPAVVVLDTAAEAAEQIAVLKHRAAKHKALQMAFQTLRMLPEAREQADYVSEALEQIRVLEG